ncbi:DUF4197 domain-containing protein [Trichloromonas sp.]|uniref:DUF4197 domain-containing protein n=1 Tax=Trichloromonas sp. TaxID=3069249 RepID=UPI002A3BFACE|nr:DUF4197 domain-containing protein [Trichloromonas sp.]
MRNNKKYASWLISGCALLLILGGCLETSGTGGQLASNVLRSLSSSGTQAAGLDESTVAAGLKEALRVGSERAVASTSTTDGFLGNQLIRIAMPDELATAAKALRAVGFGGQVDAFEVGMNRAAEKASAEAKPVLVDAVSQMTLTDAMGILRGGDTAATDYFRGKTSDTLRARFMPIIKEKMGQVGLYQQYNQLMSSYTALPLAQKPSFDLDGYVADQGLNGLFTTLAQEEKNIRANPAARTTDLLKTVFGQ